MTRASDTAKLLGAGATILDGTTISTADNTDQLTLISTDADANVGPNLKMSRQSASAADGDVLGKINFIGHNDAGTPEDISYGDITGTIIDASDGTEDGMLEISTMQAGSSVSRVRLQRSETVFNEDSTDTDFRVESNGNANMIHVDGGNDRVGIGVIPTHKFNLEGTGTVEARFRSSDGKMSLQISSNTDESNDSELNFMSGTSGRGSIVYDHHTTAANQAMLFKVADNGVEAFRISGEGKVLIGTTGSMDLGFGAQLLSVRSTSSVSPQMLGATANDTSASIIYNSSTSFGGNLCDWRVGRSNTSAFNFLQMRSNSASSNDTEFFFRGDGNAFADGSFSGGGADYAEYFEWKDGNTDNEDRRGYTVVLDGHQIRKSTSDDNASTIIGVVSSNPSMVGDSDINQWKHKYQTDNYGTYIRDENGDRVLNSSYDDTKEYISREDRQEWNTIGLMGKLRIRVGQTIGDRWIKMREISDTVHEYLVR